MAYTNKSLQVFVVTSICAISAVQPASAFESGDNLLWFVNSAHVDRVLKADKKTPLKPAIIPEYNNQTNPFPQRFAPAVQKTQARRITPEELEARVRASRATTVMEEIRKLLRDDQLFRADITEIRVNAYMNANGLVRVLTNNNWMRVGDSFDVPITSRDQLQDFLSELSDLSEDLSSIVADEVAERMTDVQTFDVIIKEIHKDKIVLMDENGLVHNIDIDK